MSANGETIHPTISEMKDFGNHEHLSDTTDGDLALRKIRTAGSISISPELFEKLYLSPKDSASAGNIIRKTIGTPTPIALVGFLLSLTPLACDLMGWRGAGQANGSAGIASYYFFGGVLMIVGGFMELLVGNTFPATVFGSFGAFWLTYGGTLNDGIYQAQSNYAANGVTAAQAQADFYNAFAFFLLWMGVLCFVYLICSLRTNIVFAVIFLSLVLAFGCLTGAFWNIAEGNVATGQRLVVAGGACAFVTCCMGWYIFASILLASLDFPITLPVGDLSRVIKGRKESQV